MHLLEPKYKAAQLINCVWYYWYLTRGSIYLPFLSPYYLMAMLLLPLTTPPFFIDFVAFIVEIHNITHCKWQVKERKIYFLKMCLCLKGNNGNQEHGIMCCVSNYNIHTVPWQVLEDGGIEANGVCFWPNGTPVLVGDNMGQVRTWDRTSLNDRNCHQPSLVTSQREESCS